MWKDKSPGVKILWIWTIGTAAVLVANVATSRVRDMNKVLNAQEEEASIIPSTNSRSTDSVITDQVFDEMSKRGLSFDPWLPVSSSSSSSY